jgi:hypothetical protein
MGEMRNSYKVMVKNPEGKRSLRRPRCRWDDNICMGLREIGWEVVYWFHLAQGVVQWKDLMNMVMKLKIP